MGLGMKLSAVVLVAIFVASAPTMVEAMSGGGGSGGVGAAGKQPAGEDAADDPHVARAQAIEDAGMTIMSDSTREPEIGDLVYAPYGQNGVLLPAVIDAIRFDAAGDRKKKKMTIVVRWSDPALQSYRHMNADLAYPRYASAPGDPVVQSDVPDVDDAFLREQLAMANQNHREAENDFSGVLRGLGTAQTDAKGWKNSWDQLRAANMVLDKRLEVALQRIADYEAAALATTPTTALVTAAAAVAALPAVVTFAAPAAATNLPAATVDPVDPATPTSRKRTKPNNYTPESSFYSKLGDWKDGNDGAGGAAHT